MTTSKNILVTIILSLSFTTVWNQSSYQQYFYSSTLKCTDKADRFGLESNDGNCQNQKCLPLMPPKNGTQEFYARKCNASLSSFDQLLQEQGVGRNISITWYFSTFTTCGDGMTYIIDATVVDSCENAENYTCKDNKSTKKCIYIDPITPKAESPSSQPDSSPIATQTPQKAIASNNDRQLSTFEKFLIGISIGGWVTAVLFFVLFIRRGQNNWGQAYEQLEQNEDGQNIQEDLYSNDDQIEDTRVPEKVRMLRIPRSELHILKDRLLGKGQCSEVYEETWRDKRVAVKIPQDRFRELALIQELTIYGIIGQHPNVLELYGYSHVTNNGKDMVCAVLELCNNGSLEGKLKKEDISIADKFSVAMGIAAGVAHLHNSSYNGTPVIHRDLKPSNILLTKKGILMVPKIADFDYSRIFASKTTAKSYSVPAVDYAAPESIGLKGEEKEYSVKSDAWSYGATIFFLLTKQPPFGERSSFLIKKRLEKKAKINYGLLYQLPNDPFTQLLVNIAINCLKDDPQERPNFDQICSQYQSFFNDFLPFNNNNININNINAM